MNVRQNKDRGFTIIEVVLVLAIAGLIFLMVFIALPALQRGQRDTQRRNDLGRVMTQVNNYQTNNRGQIPKTTATWNTLKSDYLKAQGDTFEDPSGEEYQFRNITTTAPTVPAYNSAEANIYITLNAVCNGENVDTGKGGNKVAIQMRLEGGGIACDSN